MPTPDFISGNSRYFESLMEHRFLHDLGQWLVTQDPPRLLNVLKAEVDQFGIDLVLSVNGTTRHVQMKTRSGGPPPNPYSIAESLWAMPSACVIWMLYDQMTLVPTGYFLFGPPLPDIDQFGHASRHGFRDVKMQQAPHKNLSISALGGLLFGAAEQRKAAFFFGSGISYTSNAPGVWPITKAIIEGAWKWQAPNRFVPVLGVGAVSDARAAGVQQFLRIVSTEVAKRLLDRVPPRAHYEDIFSAVQQMLQHYTLDQPNPMISDVGEVIRDASEHLVGSYPAGAGKDPFLVLLEDSRALIEWVVFHQLSPATNPDGFEVIAEVANQTSQLDIFSLNHDVLIERHLEVKGVPWADGFGRDDGDIREWNHSWIRDGRCIRLLKLHGSISWFRAKFEDRIQYVVANPPAADLKRKDRSAVDVLNNAMPLFLSGVGVKEQSYGTYLIGDLFTAFRKFLSEHRQIMFCGYGWSDHGINARLIQWLGDADNKIIILHEGGYAAVKAMPFWRDKIDPFIAMKRLHIEETFLKGCPASRLVPFFDPIEL